MSDTVNPYQSPEAVVNPVKPLIAQGALTETMLLYLKGASPWLRFIGILGMVGSGICALGGVISFTAIAFMASLWSEIPGMEDFPGFGAGAGAGASAIFGLYFLAFAAIYFFPSYFIYNFGAKIHTYLRTSADQDLEKAFKSNKSLWKFLGILSIISLAFIPVMMIVGIVVAVVASL
jgi:hypothetical protein